MQQFGHVCVRLVCIRHGAGSVPAAGRVAGMQRVADQVRRHEAPANGACRLRTDPAQQSHKRLAQAVGGARGKVSQTRRGGGRRGGVLDEEIAELTGAAACERSGVACVRMPQRPAHAHDILREGRKVAV